MKKIYITPRTVMINVDVESLISTSVTSVDSQIVSGRQTEVGVDDDGFTYSNAKASIWDDQW